MENSGLVRDIALRTSWFTFLGSLVVGAVSGALLIIVPLVAFSAGYPWLLRTLYESELPPAFNTYNPWAITELGFAGYALTGFVNGGIIGFVDGSIGGISGAVAGLVTGALARRSFSPVTYGNRRRFRRAAIFVNIVIAAAVAYIIAPVMYAFFGSKQWWGQTPGGWLVHAFLPWIVTALASWWSSRRVAAWYEDEYIEGSPTHW